MSLPPLAELVVSYEPVADGELAAVVTYLEMHAPPAAAGPPSHLSLRRLENLDPADYRRLFRLSGHAGCGSRGWSWTMPNSTRSSAILRSNYSSLPIENGNEVGMLELDFRDQGQCEIAFIGLVPELAGRGHGRWLLSEALRLAWRDGVAGSTSIPARSTIRRRSPLTAAPVSPPTSARSSTFPTRA